MSFEFDDNGIWVSSSHAVTQFSAKAQDELFAIEDRSWWFRYRGQLLLDMADKHFRRDVLTLDIGGGNGYNASRFQKSGFSVGLLEPSYKACLHGRQRGLEKVFCGELNDFSKPIEQCMLLDVLEHIEDDKGFLQTLSAHLAENGHLLLTVPAFSVLWSSEDELAGHFRRYRLTEIRRLLDEAGFAVQYASYFFSFLFLPILVVRVALERLGLLKPQQQRSEEERRRIMQKQFREPHGLTGTVLGMFEAWESSCIKRDTTCPVGSSIICIAKKKC